MRKSTEVFPRGPGARGAHGLRAPRTSTRRSGRRSSRSRRKIGCTAETLRKWVRQARARQRRAARRRRTAEQQRIKELEREVRELRKTNEILKLASAYFAQAELDRRLKK